MDDQQCFAIDDTEFGDIDITVIMKEIEEKAKLIPEPDFTCLHRVEMDSNREISNCLSELRATMFVSSGLTVPTGNFFVKILKRIFRKLTFWYVEPAIIEHSLFNQRVEEILSIYDTKICILEEEIKSLKNSYTIKQK